MRWLIPPILELRGDLRFSGFPLLHNLLLGHPIQAVGKYKRTQSLLKAVQLLENFYALDGIGPDYSASGEPNVPNLGNLLQPS